MRIDPESLARASSRHPGRTFAVWGVVLLAGIASAATLLGPALSVDFDFTNVPEAKRALQILEERRLEEDVLTETFVIDAGAAGAIEDPAFIQRVNDTLSALTALGPRVIQAVPPTFPLLEEAAADPSLAALGPFPSGDGDAVLFTAVLVGDLDEATDSFPAIEAVREEMSDGVAEVFMLGQVSSSEDFQRISEEDIRFGETIGVVAALIVLVVVFGALVAGVTPIVMGVFAIVVTLGVIGVLGLLWDFTFFAPQLVSMMGLAVGIDYSLFIVSRYREERGRGREKLEAIARSGATANRAVFFSGVTVVLALAGMLLVPTTIFRGLAGAAIIVVMISVGASMTLLPATLALLGDRINMGRVFGRNRDIEHGRAGGFWDRATRVVMARPVAWLLLAATVMVALSLPYWLQGHPEDDGRGIKTGLAGIGTLPDDTQSKQAFDLILREFPEAGSQATAELVIVGQEIGEPGQSTGGPGELTGEYATAVDALEAEIAHDPTLGAPEPPRVSSDGSVAVVAIPLAGSATDAQSEAAVLAIESLRETYVPEAFAGVDPDELLVGGESAFVKDFFDISDRYTPIIITIVLALSFVLLTIVFRSLVVPAKAIVMNLLSVGAAYGLIVLVFQEGGPAIGKSIADLFGFEQVEAIEAWLPLFLFSILFGLSMDYHVFLLTRIREEYDKTRDNAEAVAFGLRTTGGIITGAAIIMVAVFSGFASGRLTALEQMGFGLAVAVFMDATIVRSILVPSTMRLLGDRNWYLPRWLGWLPKIDVEGHEAAHAIAVPDTPAELVQAGEQRAD